MKRKLASLALSSVIAVSGLSAVTAPVSAEWVKNGSSYSYKDDSTGKTLKGWQKIDGGKYYFNKNGTAVTGWQEINGEKYYFSPSKKGKMVTSWAKIGRNSYYFGSDGVMRTGWVKLDGKTYYLGDDGIMRTGTVKVDGKTYDFGSDGVLKGSAGKKKNTGKDTKDTKKTGKKSSSKVSVSWKDSYDEVAEKLEDMDIEYITADNMIYGYEDDEGDSVIYYVFDEDDKLAMYGNMSRGNDIASARADLAKADYELYYTTNVKEAKAYVYKDAFNKIVFVYLYESKGEKYTMSMFFSPEISKDIVDGDGESFKKVIDSLGF